MPHIITRVEERAAALVVQPGAFSVGGSKVHKGGQGRGEGGGGRGGQSNLSSVANGCGRRGEALAAF